MRLRAFLVTLLVFSLIDPISATHLVGGSIRYECLPNGNYRLHLTVYQDYNSITFPQSEILHSDYPGLATISMNKVAVVDIITTCPSSVSCSSLGYACVKEHRYTSDLAYPNGISLTQTPSTSGWTFYYINCCRQPATNLSASTQTTSVLQTTLYVPAGQSISPCHDDSPKFLGTPASIAYTNQETVRHHSFSDPDGDSLAYAWGQPSNGYGVPATFYPGYSANAPFYPPGGTIPASIDPYTGDIQFLSWFMGNYFYGVQVTAYSRCTNQKVSDTYFEFYETHLNGFDSLPRFISPLGNSTATPLGAYIDTIYAGDLYQLNIGALDVDSNGSVPQSVLLSAWGSQFDSSAIGTSVTCSNPPCATLSPNLPYSSTAQATTLFEWQTQCNHLDSCHIPTEYQFFFRAEDDYCPIRNQQNATLRLMVMPPPFMLAPTLDSLDSDFAGDVTLYWTAPADPYGIFLAYCIYADTIGNGSYYLVDSITNYQTNSYVHVGANANVLTVHYMMKTYSGCGTTSSGASTSSNSLIASFVGIEEMNSDAELNIGKPYPNPNNGNFRIPLRKASSGSILVLLVDMQGKVCFESQYSLNAGLHELTIGTHGLKGNYLLLVQDGINLSKATIVVK